jgi:hypothetical protein
MKTMTGRQPKEDPEKMPAQPSGWSGRLIAAAHPWRYTYSLSTKNHQPVTETDHLSL